MRRRSILVPVALLVLFLGIGEASGVFIKNVTGSSPPAVTAVPPRVNPAAAKATPKAHGQFRIRPWGTGVEPPPIKVPEAAKGKDYEEIDDMSVVMQSPLVTGITALPEGYTVADAVEGRFGGVPISAHLLLKGDGRVIDIWRYAVGDSPVLVDESPPDATTIGETTEINGVPAFVRSGPNFSPFELQFVTNGIETVIQSMGLKLPDVQPWVEKWDGLSTPSTPTPAETPVPSTPAE